MDRPSDFARRVLKKKVNFVRIPERADGDLADAPKAGIRAVKVSPNLSVAIAPRWCFRSRDFVTTM